MRTFLVITALLASSTSIAQIIDGTCTPTAGSDFTSTVSTTIKPNGNAFVNCNYVVKQPTGGAQLVGQERSLFADCPTDKTKMIGSGFDFKPGSMVVFRLRPIDVTAQFAAVTSSGVGRNHMSFYFDKGIMSDMEINVSALCE